MKPKLNDARLFDGGGRGLDTRLPPRGSRSVWTDFALVRPKSASFSFRLIIKLKLVWESDFLLSNSHLPIIEKHGTCLALFVHVLVFSTKQPKEQLLALDNVLNVNHSASLVTATHTR